MNRKKHFFAVIAVSAIAATGMALEPIGLILTIAMIPVLLWLAFTKTS